MPATTAMPPPPKRPLLMGILNLTPDSFSGDGVLGPAALDAAERIVEAGADWLDIGAESTRPHGQAVTPEQEWQRLQSLLPALAAQPWRARVKLSVDTRHAATAERALALGVDVINDVAGLADPRMGAVLRQARCDVVVMHALTLPADPAVTLPPDCDVVADVLRWKDEVSRRAEAAGVEATRLLHDPGIGFGKSALQSLALMHAAPRLVQSGGRWLYGHSRKSFLRLFTELDASQRDDLTLALSARLVADGVHVIRVHEVARHARLLQSLRALRTIP